MKIGIFLGYGPQVKLGKEGLGRYIGGLIKGFLEQNNDVVIACPFWLKETLEDLLESFSVNKADVVVVTTKDNPVIWKLYCLLTRKSKKHERLKKILKRISLLVGEILKKIVRSDSYVAFLCWSILALLLMLTGVVPVTFLAVFLVIMVLKRYLLLGIDLCWPKIKNRNTVKEILPENLDIQLEAFYQLTDSVLETLVKKINANQQMDVWFVPAIFWPQVNNIRGTVIINAPDLVSQEFPEGFADVYGADRAIKDCRRTLLEGKYFITYCEFLRRRLLLDQYAKDASNVVAIEHANNDMAPYLQIDDRLNKQIASNTDWSDVFAKDILARYASRNVKYIFYASQIRPSKNMLNLVKAYEYLLRRKFIGYKLYVTADLQKETEVSMYIKKHHLENDVFSVYNVSAQTLAALYYCADLVVNPTLYEGGFPFTFGEGMSVGTPSIMSDIPQVRDILSPAGLEDVMFEPTEWKDIANKIEWALSDLDGLYKKELPLYEQISKRTYSVMASDYIGVFKMFSERDIDIKKK